MKIVILGAGPAGLYSALLLKKLDPSHEITIFERNPRGATYGWGVVFSDQTLNAFREADYTTYTQITDQFVVWEAIDLWYRGQLARCGGHGFAGMARRKLLEILENRCEALGVKICFEAEITEPSQFSGADLVIAADGLNSMVRTAYEEAFRPELEMGRSKYIWYGTHRVFDSFTFIFRENEHGLFQVHAYPFDGATSTFIVECEEAVWKRAGLAEADEAESITYCEKLFAPDLHGHALLSNRSRWINFITVKNRTWSHKNIVLMGDAAHTAHFSIGSGTKLAMEDAIALANAFEKHGDKMGAALKDYEAERRPRVQLLQEAARESQAYFETVKQYLHLDPMQFSFYLLTRSGRITYDSLRLRDPYYSDRVDRWYAGQNDGLSSGSEPIIALPPMFAALKLREVTLPNRVVLAVTSTGTAEEGLPNSTHGEQLLHRARGGAALVMTEPVAVSAEGRITSGCPGLYRPGHVAAWRSFNELIHTNTGARVGLLLNHAGRRGATRPRRQGVDQPLRQGAWPLVSASALPYSPQSQTPKALSRAEMEEIRESFVQATRLAAEASFDLLQLHLAHGYLLASFLSPLANRREDEYGGSLENRLRFPLEIFEAVRAAWPSHKPLAVALNASDWAKGGVTLAEAIEVTKQLKAKGCDLVEPLAGQTTLQAQPTYGPYFLAPYSDQIRNQTGIVTMTSGGITLADHVNSLLASGRADLCVMHPLHLND